MDGGFQVGQRVRLLSPVETFRTVMPEGLELWVDSAGGPGRWNLRDAAGVVRISALEAERFELVEGAAIEPVPKTDTDRSSWKPAAKYFRPESVAKASGAKRPKASGRKAKRKAANSRQGALFG